MFRQRMRWLSLVVMTVLGADVLVAGPGPRELRIKCETLKRFGYRCVITRKTIDVSSNSEEETAVMTFDLVYDPVADQSESGSELRGRIASILNGAEGADWTNETFTVRIDHRGQIAGVEWSPKSMAAAVPLVAGLSNTFLPLPGAHVREGQSWESERQELFADLKVQYIGDPKVHTWEQTIVTNGATQAQITAPNCVVERFPESEKAVAVMLFRSLRRCSFWVEGGVVLSSRYVSHAEHKRHGSVVIYDVHCRLVPRGTLTH